MRKHKKQYFLKLFSISQCQVQKKNMVSNESDHLTSYDDGQGQKAKEEKEGKCLRLKTKRKVSARIKMKHYSPLGLLHLYSMRHPKEPRSREPMCPLGSSSATTIS